MSEVFHEDRDPQVRADMRAEDDGYPAGWPRTEAGTPMDRREID